MNSSKTKIKKSFYMNIEPICSKIKLRNAIRHNYREIQAELGANSHIDATRTHLNQNLVPKTTAADLMLRVTDVIEAYESQHSRRIRKDAVLAIEVLFSLPVMSSEIPVNDYFRDCLSWAKDQLKPGEVISADVHLDEAAPHMHVIFLAVTPSALNGARIKGYKSAKREREQNFYDNVAAKYGLQAPPTKLTKWDRVLLAKKVLSKIESSDDPLTRSQHFPLIKTAIELDPSIWAQNLGIEIEVTPRKMRTSTQILTSKGKGPQWQPEV